MNRVGIEETGRAQRGEKYAGGMFFRSGEIPMQPKAA